MTDESSPALDRMQAVWKANMIVTDALPGIMAGTIGPDEIVTRLRAMQESLAAAGNEMAHDALAAMIDMFTQQRLFPDGIDAPAE